MFLYKPVKAHTSGVHTEYVFSYFLVLNNISWILEKLEYVHQEFSTLH